MTHPLAEKLRLSASVFEETDWPKCSELMSKAADELDRLSERVRVLEGARKQLRDSAESILDPENKPGYELREFAEEVFDATRPAKEPG